MSSIDFATWRRLGTLVGEVRCHWAGPHATVSEPGFHVERRPRGGPLRDARWLLGVIRRATSDARHHDDAVVNGADPIGWIAAFVVSRLAKRPVVLDFHSDLTRLPADSVGRRHAVGLALLGRVLARRATAVRVVAATTADDLARDGIESTIIPSRLAPAWGATPEIRTQKALRDPGRIVVVSVGRMVASKGFDIVLEAFAALRHRIGDGLELRLIGDGPERARLETMARDFGQAPAVHFTGRVSPEQVRAELLAADVLVIASSYEGMPRTLLEGLAAGLPVVSTPVGGIPALAHDFSTVTLANRNPASLTSALAATITTPPSPGALDKAQRLALERFGFEANLRLVATQFREASAP